MDFIEWLKDYELPVEPKPILEADEEEILNLLERLVGYVAVNDRQQSMRCPKLKNKRKINKRKKG